KCTLPAETKVTVKVNLTAPELSSVKWDSRKMTIEVAWNKNITAKGYVIQFSSQKSFATVEKKIKIDSGNTVRISVPGPKRGTYYVRIRTINRELHSRWSRIKTVNVKYRTLKRAN
ncbi:MAG: hypothetical protein Q4D81_14470, partial [Eubacteriales bacterium]|nr:hypothetical protein [Eubacteriales bacterium]